MAKSSTPNSCQPSHPHSGSIGQTHVDWTVHGDKGQKVGSITHDTSPGSIALGQARQDRNDSNGGGSGGGSGK